MGRGGEVEGRVRRAKERQELVRTVEVVWDHETWKSVYHCSGYVRLYLDRYSRDHGTYSHYPLTNLSIPYCPAHRHDLDPL